MCGIAGYIAPENPSSLRDALPRVMARLRHRGPDDEGICVPPDQRRPGAVGLANTRLAILDLSRQSSADVERGRPMDAGVQRRAVQLPGAPGRAGTAGPSIPFGERHGSPAQGLRGVGMRRCRACWNVRPGHLRSSNDRVTLARDPFGIKPLYYAAASAGLRLRDRRRAGISRHRPERRSPGATTTSSRPATPMRAAGHYSRTSVSCPRRTYIEGPVPTRVAGLLVATRPRPRGGRLVRGRPRAWSVRRFSTACACTCAAMFRSALRCPAVSTPPP